MPNIFLKSAVFDQLENALNTPDPSLTYASSFDKLANAAASGPVKVLQLSSTLIRVSQDITTYTNGQPLTSTFEMRLSGSGIGPVSTLNALISAIDNGLARGTLNRLEILDTGMSFLVLTMDAAGYHLTSGDTELSLNGALPLTFGQFSNIAKLFTDVARIDVLTSPERAALFSDLTAYSVTGLTLTDAGRVLFGIHMDATTLSLTLNGLTLSATGSFPGNLGQDIEALWNAIGSGKPLHVTGFGGLGFTALTLTDASGLVLGRVNDPLAATPDVTRVDGKIYGDVQFGDNGNDTIAGPTSLSHMLAGLGGQDMLRGGLKADFLMGGSGQDMLFGFGSADRLDGGKGNDTMTGGSGADVFHFDLADGFDRITDFTLGQDVIEILSAAKLADLTFTKLRGGVEVDFRTVHVFVEGVTIPQLNHIENFHF